MVTFKTENLDAPAILIMITHNKRKTSGVHESSSFRNKVLSTSGHELDRSEQTDTLYPNSWRNMTYVTNATDIDVTL